MEYTDTSLVNGIACDLPKRMEQAYYAASHPMYGPRIPTKYRIQYGDEKRWRRVWVMNYANSGTAYVIVNGQKLILDSTTEWALSYGHIDERMGLYK